MEEAADGGAEPSGEGTTYGDRHNEKPPVRRSLRELPPWDATLNASYGSFCVPFTVFSRDANVEGDRELKVARSMMRTKRRHREETSRAEANRKRQRLVQRLDSSRQHWSNHAHGSRRQQTRCARMIPMQARQRSILELRRVLRTWSRGGSTFAIGAQS